MKLSVICPTYNAEKLIGRSLQSWLGQDIPKDEYEIIVVDRNSGDKTQEIVTGFSEKDNNVKLVISPPRTSTQRNNGIKASTGKVILFLDDDSIPELQNHFKAGLKFIGDHSEIDIVGGPQVDSPNDRFFARAAGAAMSSLFGSFVIASRYRRMKQTFDADEFCLTSANVFVRKEVFGSIGGFNETLYPGEDPEFFARAKKNGIRMAFAPELAVQHSRRPTLKAFCKQHFKYGQTRVLKERIAKTPFPQNAMFLVPSAFFIYILLLPPLSQIGTVLLWPAAIYALLAVLFALPAAVYSKVPLVVFLVPFLFFAMHVSYGAGFLYGLIKTKI